MSDIEGTGAEPTPQDAYQAPVTPASQPESAGASAPAADSPTVPLPPAAAPAFPAPGAGAMTPPPLPQASAPSAQPTRPVASAPQGSGAGFGLPPAPGARPPMSAQPKRHSGVAKVVGLLVAAAVVGGAAGVGMNLAGYSLVSPAGSTSAAVRPGAVTVNTTSEVTPTTAIAAKVVPSVVTINVSAGNSGGTGSGVILSADGYVLTNTHVVTLDGQSGDAQVSVTTSDGHIYQAKVVGTDPTYDLAVIKLVGASGLTPITWGDSSALNVGDSTIAVGAPLGLSNTVTTGIVSALNRSIQIASSAAPQGQQGQNGQGEGGQGENGQGQQGPFPFFFDFGDGGQGGQGSQGGSSTAQQAIDIAVIQTDAPINPGNSGGALVDGAGKLVGINVAIASTGQSSSQSGSQSGSIGVGFSIPSDIAHRVATEIIKDGSATHGLLGATVRDAASMKDATITGADVVSVSAGGGAAAAGLRAGDIITEFDKVPIGGAVDLTAQVRALASGSTAQITFVRDGQSHTAQVTLGTLK